MNEINKPELIEAADSQPIKEMIGGVSAWFKVLWMPLLLILGTFVVFWPVRKHGFINLDDPDYVYSNRHVRSGLTMEGVNWAFSTT